MIRIFFLSMLLCVLSAGSAFSASNTTVVNGRVIDKNSGNPLSYATVAIRNDEDVVVAGATSAEDGTFEMANVPYGSYRMITSFMGYKNLEIDVTLEASKLDVGTIELEEDAQTLATAVITAKVPVIEHKLDKIVMNVSEAVSTQGSNALEVLRKAPGVTIDMDGNVKLNGQAVSIWIDGRPSYLSGLELEALLRSTDGTTIDKIELMAHPS
ncbi:MAG TPA: carboxypeptidase-like regulatory domain-containing protein, partial [Bacteroidales bacterium]|nr:carboxypeptidase-like regulatory domain-containing protein [Bacteroidales bacterium]